MRNKIIILTSLGLILLFLIVVVLYNEIPRFTYTYNEDLSGYVITKCHGNVKKYTIPKMYKDKEVVGIARDVFRDKTNLEELDLSETNIENIGMACFSGCYNLKKITFNEEVNYIANNAFFGCSNLEEIELKNTNLRILGGSVFFDCINLKKVSLPSGLEEVGSYAFYNTSLEELNIYKQTILLDDALLGVDETIINYLGE